MVIPKMKNENTKDNSSVYMMRVRMWQWIISHIFYRYAVSNTYKVRVRDNNEISGKYKTNKTM